MTARADYDVIVIGSGLNGLVAGTWLARHRRSVLIVDQRPLPGGAAATTEFTPGFRAPTLSHALGPVSADVLLALGIDAAACGFIRPDPALVTLGPKGQAVSFHQDALATSASIAAVSAGDAERWPAFIDAISRVGRLASSIAAQPPPEIDDLAARDLWQWLTLARESRKLDARDLAHAAQWVPMAVADLVSDWFDSDLVQAAIAAHAIFGNLAGPRSAGTGGYLLQRVAADPLPVGSSVTIKGGPGALGKLLERAATRAGATIRQASRVERVVIDGDAARGVTLDDGTTVTSRAVLAAIDPKQLFLQLIEPTALPPTFLQRMENYRARGVTAKMNLALSAAPAFGALAGRQELARGRVLIAPSLDYLERAFDAAKYGGCSPRPWLDLAVPTFADPSMAPAGRHVMSIHAHFAPYALRDQTWDDAAVPFTRSVMRVLEEACPGIESLVVGREVITPPDMERRWGLTHGHVFHGEPAMDQSWIARPTLGWSRHATPVAGLFSGSAGTHPGGGLTGLPGLHSGRAVDGALG